jgi:hypothetical protein
LGLKATRLRVVDRVAGIEGNTGIGTEEEVGTEEEAGVVMTAELEQGAACYPLPYIIMFLYRNIIYLHYMHV